MPRPKRYNARFALSWHDPRKCWKKHFQGRTYYVGRGRCTGKYDKAGYALALDEWSATLASLEANQEGDDPPGLYSDPTDWGGVSMGFATNYAAVTKLGTPTPAKVAALPADIGGLVDAFLAECRTMAETGQFSLAMYNDLRYRLKDFVGFCEHHKSTDIVDLNNNLLAAYRQAQIGLTGLTKAQGGVSPTSAKKRLQFLARFVGWLADREAIPAIPKIINRKYAAVKLAPPKPKFFTVEQVRTLMGEASPLQQACILLALNTGATQVDVSTLEYAHLDLNAGILKRPRNKTGVQSEYVLWPETVAAIQKVRTNAKTSTLVILSETGKPLVRESFRDDGRLVRVDSVSSMFALLMKRAKIESPGMGFKHFRKTSADLIAQKFPPHCVDQFLAHVTSTMRKHYAGEHLTPEFRAALEYLRTTYNLTEAKP